jgi:hypothetical protein
MQITRNEIATLSNTWYAAREAALAKVLTEAAAPFIGRRFKQVLTLGSRKAGTWGEYLVEAEVVRATTDWEGGMILVGAYTHPITGKPTMTEVTVDEFPDLAEDDATAG